MLNSPTIRFLRTSSRLLSRRDSYDLGKFGFIGDEFKNFKVNRKYLPHKNNVKKDAENEFKGISENCKCPSDEKNLTVSESSECSGIPFSERESLEAEFARFCILRFPKYKEVNFDAELQILNFECELQNKFDK